MTAGGISLHAVDVATGTPAQGMRVELVRLDGGTTVLIAEGVLGAGGALDHPDTRGPAVVPGSYEARFHLGDWYEARFHLGDWWRARERSDERFFQEVAVFRFDLADVTAHVHLPIKFTRWGFALFRGA